MTSFGKTFRKSGILSKTMRYELFTNLKPPLRVLFVDSCIDCYIINISVIYEYWNFVYFLLWVKKYSVHVLTDNKLIFKDQTYTHTHTHTLIDIY